MEINPGILRRQEALGHRGIEHHRDGERQHRHEEGHTTIAQHTGQRAGIEIRKTIAERIGDACQQAGFRFVLRLVAVFEQLRAHHRRQRQGDHRRNHHRKRQREREFAEHPPDKPGHEQERDEHREQRHRERNHREPDLGRAKPGRRLAILPRLAMPGDILDHHDGIIDDKPGANRERHQREIVEAEPGEPHHCEGADKG